MTSKRFIILLFCLAFISGIFWSVTYGEDPTWGSDSFGYNKKALTILEKGIFFKDVQISERPIYPIFLAGAYKVFGHNYWPVRIIQIFLFVFTCFLVYRICQMIFNERIARLASIMTALCYSIASFTGLFFRESLFTFLIILLIYCLYKAQLSYKNIWFVFSGIIMGLAILTNMVLQFFPLIIIINFLIIGREFGFKKLYPKIALFFIAFSITISPWIISDYYHFGRIASGYGSGLLLREKIEKTEVIEGKYIQHLVGNILGDFFASRLFLDYDRTETKYGYDTRQRFEDWANQNKDLVIIDSIFVQEAKTGALKHPIMFLKMTLIDFLKFNTPLAPNVRMTNMFTTTHPELSDFTKGSIILFIRFFYLIFFALITYTVVKYIKKWGEISWIILIIFYFNFIYSILSGFARYSAPIYPFYIILATIGLLIFWDKIRNTLIAKAKSSYS